MVTIRPSMVLVLALCSNPAYAQINGCDLACQQQARQERLQAAAALQAGDGQSLRLASVVFFAGASVDIVSSAIPGHCHEQNAAFAWANTRPVAMAATNAAITVAHFYLLRRVGRKYPRALGAILAGAGLARGAVAAHNVDACFGTAP